MSGPRTFKRLVKKASSSISRQKSDHQVYEQAQCELDTRADTICAGKNCRIISLTGQTCNVSGFHQSFGLLKNIPVAQVATAFITDTGEVVVLVINKALYFGQSMDHSLINPNQIRHFWISVSNNPYDEVHDFGIDHEECFIPFETEGSTVFFDTFVPSDEQLNTC